MNNEGRNRRNSSVSQRSMISRKSKKSKKSSQSSVIIKQLTLEERENIEFFAKYDKLVLKNNDIKNNDKTELNELREKIYSEFP